MSHLCWLEWFVALVWLLQNSRTVPAGGLEWPLLTSMGSNVGSSSRMSLLRLSREMSSSGSPWLPLGCWWTVSCADSRQMVWPTLRTWLGIICVMPSAAGIMLGELSGFWERTRYNREIGYSVLARFCPLLFPPPHIRRKTRCVLETVVLDRETQSQCLHAKLCGSYYSTLLMSSNILPDILFSPNEQSFIFLCLDGTKSIAVMLNVTAAGTDTEADSDELRWPFKVCCGSTMTQEEAVDSRCLLSHSCHS